MREGRGRGFYRPRLLAEPESFSLQEHLFETDGKDLWVTVPGAERIDRIKVTRYISSKSMRHGYPTELVRPEPMTQEFAWAAAQFWLSWSRTADFAGFPPVFLDHFVRQQEKRQLISPDDAFSDHPQRLTVEAGIHAFRVRGHCGQGKTRTPEETGRQGAGRCAQSRYGAHATGGASHPDHDTREAAVVDGRCRGPRSS